jgi:photosystem II stability/assembly factor-like uncharacterized protein
VSCWATAQGRLYWTSNNGASWADITPPGSATAFWVDTQRAFNSSIKLIRQALFLDSSHGWVILSSGSPKSEGGTGLSASIGVTEDGGNNWVLHPLHLSPNLQDTYPDSLFFQNAHRGWLLMNFRCHGANCPAGLLVTEDGGVNWAELSSAPDNYGSLYFITPQIGWFAGDSLYATTDSGRTWQHRTIPLPSDCAACPVEYDPPKFQDSQNGLLTVTMESNELFVTASYVTSDGGVSWRAAEVYEQWHPTSNVAPASIGNSHAIRAYFSPQSGIRIRVAGKTIVPSLPANLMEGGSIGKLDFTDDSNGWASYGSGELLSTTDGAKTFKTITPRPPTRKP